MIISRSQISNPYRHGIDFKNPFTMSKWTVAVRTAAKLRISCLHLWKNLVEPIGIEPMT